MFALFRLALKQKSQIAKLTLIVVFTLFLCFELSAKWTRSSEDDYDFSYQGRTLRVGEEVEIKQGGFTKRPSFLRHLRTRTINPLKKIIRDDLPVQRADKATTGSPWPHPRSMTTSKDQFLLVQGDKLEFVTQGKSCAIVERALRRHKEMFRKFFVSNVTERANLTYLNTINVAVVEDCVDYPSEEMDESYELILTDSSNSLLRANQLWGILQGLETLHQLIYWHANFSTPTGDAYVVPHATIEDKPRFLHRGILIDSSRHFLKKETIFRNLDAMAQVKFNVLHWHMIDDQSFPFESKVFPDLTLKGAFKDTKGKPVYYTQEDILQIVNYARDRGIRVIPEFDTPGHTESWQGGLPDILSECPGRRIARPGPIDPTKNITYVKLKMLFQEIIQLFPEKYLHLGGDECSYFCWSTSPEKATFMEQNHMKEYSELFQYYENRLVNTISEIDKNTVPVFWQEVYEEGTKLPPHAVFHFWKNDLFGVPYQNATRDGHKIIFSSCWYLNYVRYGTDWQTYYSCDPEVFLREPGKTHDNLIGGEACMWGEYVDDTNLLQYLWPRAIAVAERLWSPSYKLNIFAAPARFEEQKCRFMRRGIPATPQLGPSPPCAF